MICLCWWLFLFFFEGTGDHRDIHVLTHSFPTRRSSDLILLDEPFNALDTRTVTDLLALMQRWHGERRTVIAVLHDFEIVRRHFPDVVYLARRLVGWGPRSEEHTSELQSLMRISYAVFCLKKKKTINDNETKNN